MIVTRLLIALLSLTLISATDPGDRSSTGWWADRHRAILATIAARPDPQVVLIGDSITQNYEKATLPDENFQPIWQRFYAPRGAINLGFSGDTTTNVLWRLQHGEVAGLRPKAVVLLVGTNDTAAGRSATETQTGIDTIVADLKWQLPMTKILLVGILPSAVSAVKSASDATVNRYLARRYAGDARVTFVDVGRVLRRPDGSLDEALFYDPRLTPPRRPLHPDTIGQRRVAETIEPTLVRLLGVRTAR